MSDGWAGVVVGAALVLATANCGCITDALHLAGYRYYFDGQGKLFRPMLVCLTGRACRAKGARTLSLGR